MSTVCDCTDARLETYETPSGHTITRCIDCGAMQIDSQPEAVDTEATSGDPWQALSHHIAAGTSEGASGQHSAWPDIADLSIPKMLERLDEIEDDDERAAMTTAVVAWEKAQHNPRKGILDLEDVTPPADDTNTEVVS